MDKDNITSVPFPLGGLDVSQEYEMQPAGTSRDALNVRACDPSTMRLRGGSRPGLSKYVPQTVSGLPGLVQHLNVLVDPTTPALLANFIQQLVTDPTTGGAGGPNGIPDPSSGGRNDDWGVPNGGTAVQPNRSVGHGVPLIGAELEIGIITSGSGVNYQITLVDTGQSVTAVMLESTVQQAIGSAVLVAKVSGQWRFSPFLFR